MIEDGEIKGRYKNDLRENPKNQKHTNQQWLLEMWNGLNWEEHISSSTGVKYALNWMKQRALCTTCTT